MFDIDRLVMSYFRYKLMEPTGQVTSGVISLPYHDVMSAISYFEREDKTTIYVKKLGSVASFIYKLLSLRFKRSISRSFQAEFFANIALMIRAGMTLTTALEEAAGTSDRPDLVENISDMIVSIQGGMSFSEAASGYRYIFPETVVFLIRIGEETGHLDVMLQDASEHLKRIQKIVSETKQALLYPTCVFLAMGAGIIFWFYYVVPKIVSLFTEMDVSLPPITVFLLRISEFVQDHFLSLILGFCVVILSLITAYKSNRRIKKTIDVVLLKLPLSRTIISASTLAFITEYFSLLIQAGVHILQSMKILIESVRNEVYKEKLHDVREGITRGDGIADSFMSTGIFPLFVVRMINVGELSGTLPQQLSHIAEEYRNKLSLLVSTIGKMIEPVVLIIAGVIFAVIVGG
ncbi:MAG: type II secretion system F family protein, partial [Thermodesulfobacteriota bacterium]|nr:type II secretion system F family protein [Thermodesulfobacteriota bacterium]